MRTVYLLEMHTSFYLSVKMVVNATLILDHSDTEKVYH